MTKMKKNILALAFVFLLTIFILEIIGFSLNYEVNFVKTNPDPYTRINEVVRNFNSFWLSFSLNFGLPLSSDKNIYIAINVLMIIFLFVLLEIIFLTLLMPKLAISKAIGPIILLTAIFMGTLMTLNTRGYWVLPVLMTMLGVALTALYNWPPKKASIENPKQKIALQTT